MYLYPLRLINGKELTAKDGVQVEKDVANNKFSLTIPKINSNVHAGTVTIKATNSLGSAQHDIILNVDGNKLIFLRLLILFSLTVCI